MPLYAFSVEGVITNIVASGNGVNVTLMGMTIFIDKSAQQAGRITTSSDHFSALNFADILDPAPLPGLVSAGPGFSGFAGGTAIINGNYNTDFPGGPRLEVVWPAGPANSIVPGVTEEFPSVKIGPPETVLAGPITTPFDGTSMAVNGIKVILINPDLPRRPLVPPKNEFGFEIKLTQVPVNTLTTVNGYYSVRDSVFIGYEVVVDSDNSTILTTQSPQISITKAQSRLRGGSYDVNVSGAITTFQTGISSDPQFVEVRRVDGGVVDPNPIVFNQPVRNVGKPFSKWTIRGSFPVPPTPHAGPATHYRVFNKSADAVALNGAPIVADEPNVDVIKG